MPDEESQGGAQEEEVPATAEQPPEAKAGEPAEEEHHSRPQPPAGGIADLLAAALPDVELNAYQGLSHVIVEVSRDDLLGVMSAAKEDPQLHFNYLRCLSGVDNEDDGLEVVYQLMSLDRGHEVVIKVRLPHDDAHVASVSSVWKAANWHERETRDMFGIIFDDHPHLVPLLLPEDMTDHFPLRKDSPLAEIEEWQAEHLPDAGDEARGDGGDE